MTFILSSIVLFSSILMVASLSRTYFGGRLWLVSPPILFLVYFVLTGMGGVIFSSWKIDEPAPILGHALWFAGMSCGILLGSHSKIVQKNRMIIQPANFSLTAAIYITLGILAVIATFFMYKRIPLLIGIDSIFGSQGAVSMHTARQMNTIAHRAGETSYFGQGYLRIFYTVVAPIFISALYVMDAERTRSVKPSPTICFLFVVFFIFGIANGQIWLGMTVAMIFIVASVYVFSRHSPRPPFQKLWFRALIGYISFFVVILGYRTLQVIGGREIRGDVLTNTIDRLYNYPQARLFYLFPEHLPYRLGSTWWNDILGILPGPREAFAYEVHYLVHGGGWGFTLSPGVIASTFVNFGMPGVFIVGILASWISSLIFMKMIHARDPLVITVGLYASLRFALGNIGDVGLYIVDAIICALVLLMYYFTRRFFSALARL